MLLDKVFLKWYLTKFYGMNLDDDYKIHIILLDIEIIRFSSISLSLYNLRNNFIQSHKYNIL